MRRKIEPTQLAVPAGFGLQPPLPAPAIQVKESGGGASSRTHVCADSEISGQQMGLAGIGKGETFGMIPMRWTARQLENTPHWIKILVPPGPGPAIRGRHYEIAEPIGWAPAQVIFHRADGRSMIAMPEDSASQCEAASIILSNYKRKVEVSSPHVEEVDEVSTPSTPPTPPAGATQYWSPYVNAVGGPWVDPGPEDADAQSADDAMEPWDPWEETLAMML